MIKIYIKFNQHLYIHIVCMYIDLYHLDVFDQLISDLSSMIASKC